MTPNSSTPRSFGGFSPADHARLDQMLVSQAAVVISFFKSCDVQSLHELDFVNRLQKSDPRQYALLVAEAQAQGLPIN